MHKLDNNVLMGTGTDFNWASPPMPMKFGFMSGSCHLDRASNVKIGVECKYLLLLSFLTAAKFYNLGHIQGIIGVH